MIRKPSLNYAAAVCILGLGALARLYLDKPRELPPQSLTVHQFPVEIGGWTSKLLEADELTIEILGTEDILERQYVEPGTDRFVNLLIVFAVNNREAFHEPQYCMTGVGSNLVVDETRTIDVPGIGEQPFNYMVFSMQDRRGSDHKVRLVMANLYACRRTMTADWMTQQMNIMLDGLGGRPASGAMIRYTTPVVTTDEDAWEFLQTFVRMSLPIVPDYLPGIGDESQAPEETTED